MRAEFLSLPDSVDQMLHDCGGLRRLTQQLVLTVQEGLRSNGYSPYSTQGDQERESAALPRVQ